MTTDATDTFPAFLAAVRPAIDDTLDRLLPAAEMPPARLHEAVRYSIFAGGKRVRPALALLVGRGLGLAEEDVLPGAAALEMIHTYSLIHDDLPALDDDDLRRGRPTLHRAYDEATAILAGDTLLTLGLATLAGHPATLDAGARARAVAHVGAAIGSRGMIGGQVDDLAAEDAWPDDDAEAGRLLAAIHRRKTGALIAAAVELPGIYAGLGEGAFATLGRLGHALGLMFQIRDDMIDVEGTDATLGKTAGKDADARKLTYPGLYGLDGARRRLGDAAGDARRFADDLPRGGTEIRSLVSYLATREH